MNEQNTNNFTKDLALFCSKASRLYLIHFVGRIILLFLGFEGILFKPEYLFDIFFILLACKLIATSPANIRNHFSLFRFYLIIIGFLSPLQYMRIVIDYFSTHYYSYDNAIGISIFYRVCTQIYPLMISLFFSKFLEINCTEELLNITRKWEKLFRYSRNILIIQIAVSFFVSRVNASFFSVDALKLIAFIVIGIAIASSLPTILCFFWLETTKMVASTAASALGNNVSFSKENAKLPIKWCFLLLLPAFAISFVTKLVLLDMPTKDTLEHVLTKERIFEGNIGTLARKTTPIASTMEVLDALFFGDNPKSIEFSLRVDSSQMKPTEEPKYISAIHDYRSNAFKNFYGEYFESHAWTACNYEITLEDGTTLYGCYANKVVEALGDGNITLPIGIAIKWNVSDKTDHDIFLFCTKVNETAQLDKSLLQIEGSKYDFVFFEDSVNTYNQIYTVISMASYILFLLMFFYVINKE